MPSNSVITNTIKQCQKIFFEILSRRTIVLILQILIVGSIYGLIFSRATDLQIRKSLSINAQSLAAVFNYKRIVDLSGTIDDIGTPNYEYLKKALTKVRQSNPDLRFVYLLGYRDGDMFFFVDSEPTDSEGYSPPGDVYHDATLIQIYNFINGISFTEGPYTDAWGTWVSGYAPIFDENGQVVAVIGLDVDARLWSKKIIFTIVPPMIASFVVIGMIIISHRILLKREKQNINLALETNKKRQ